MRAMGLRSWPFHLSCIIGAAVQVRAGGVSGHLWRCMRCALRFLLAWWRPYVRQYFASASPWPSHFASGLPVCKPPTGVSFVVARQAFPLAVAMTLVWWVIGVTKHSCELMIMAYMFLYLLSLSGFAHFLAPLMEGSGDRATSAGFLAACSVHGVDSSRGQRNSQRRQRTCLEA